MPLQKKFSLAALFVLMTLAVLLLGYGQWRRQQLLRQIEELEDSGVTLFVRDGWWTKAWLPTPRGAQVQVHEERDGQFRFDDVAYALPEVDEHIAQLRQRLREVGVKHFLVDATMLGGNRHQISFDLEKGEEANSRYQLSDAAAPPAPGGEPLKSLQGRQ